ncbi:penicillin-binding protein [Iamia sp. SCSIO 61187]|uniref:penicillin-binding transpeptidase domain-containing protein n=1 Tax=Iamia sp. SCSIO 61187 TaxID=2722752 RepID=UPI001C63A177|nr:penicillin-binding transpeptidase domain-containing protein [Iamia sp. SCSIO 61187]QYG95177.1 penicillin-binding protein [Iamia sp. SCSIO 61187]
MLTLRPHRARVAVGAALVLVLAACSGGSDEADEPDPSDPSTTAEAFAAGLPSGEVAGIAFVAPATAAGVAEELDAITAELGDLRPEVEVTTVDEADGDTARASLAVSWSLGPDVEPWIYGVDLHLRRVDDVWAVDWDPSVVEPSLTDGERLEVAHLRPARGEILGAGGVPIVTARPVRRIGIDRATVDPATASTSAVALAQLVGLDDPEGYRGRVDAAGPRAFVEAIVVRTDGSFPLDEAAVAAIPGAVALGDEIPLAPTTAFARPLLGTVGDATAELIEESDGALRPGDTTGLSGLQLAHEEQLRGQPGIEVVARAEGATGRVLVQRERVDGTPLATTLDVPAQTVAEDVLADVGPASAVVAIRPSSGEVLAAASGPGGEGYSTATVGQYAPGSTFKVVTALALLRAGIDLEAELDCPATIDVGGRSFKNYDDYPASRTGAISLRQAIASSCNTALIGSEGVVSQADLAAAAEALGLGRDPVLGVPSFTGSVPDEAEQVEHAASMIGQGRVLASPLAMATVAATIARGEVVTPTLVAGPDGAPDAGEPPAEPITPEEAEALRSLMRAVVTDGSATFLADVPGAEVGAKTGTAEYGEERPPRTHAWMIAVQGDLAVSVFVEDGAGGATTAGPILEEALRGLQPG